MSAPRPFSWILPPTWSLLAALQGPGILARSAVQEAVLRRGDIPVYWEERKRATLGTRHFHVISETRVSPRRLLLKRQSWVFSGPESAAPWYMACTLTGLVVCKHHGHFCCVQCLWLWRECTYMYVHVHVCALTGKCAASRMRSQLARLGSATNSLWDCGQVSFLGSSSFARDTWFPERR